MNTNGEQSGRGTDAGRGATGTPAPAVATLRSRDLFAGSREVIIEHQGDSYRLRCTSKGKLILTK
tara:strand:- start:363 stop:557 length:195 start_codon:yes stop_codon:yes gene_type:complete